LSVGLAARPAAGTGIVMSKLFGFRARP